VSRLLALLVVAWLPACGAESEPTPAAPAPSRVDAVAAAPTKDPLADFCEVRPDPQKRPTFRWPELDEPAPEAGSGWTWVNVWATWCGPCVEEMARVTGWEARLQEELGPGAVRFLSVDGKAEDVQSFRSRHPSTPPSVRLKDLAGLPAFLASLELDATAALPLQVFLDGEHRVRCVRVGAVEERDYARVKLALQPAMR
jgi:thiol-disulfide isomerase/thioredoxin